MNGDEITHPELKSGEGNVGHDIIVIGASAGGVETLVKLTGNLPGDIPAALFVVLHVPPDSPSLVPTILNRHG